MEETQQAAALISRLNDGKHASDANTISQKLQDLQLSPRGWFIADGLLSSSDPTLQFYGALTFQVKLNRDAASLTEEDGGALQARLIHIFNHCVLQRSKHRVIDKLCSCLSTFVLLTPTLWEDPLGRVLMDFVGGISGKYEAAVSNLVDTLPSEYVQALVRLGGVLAQDLARAEGSTPKSHMVETSLRRSVTVFVALVRSCLRSSSGSEETFRGVLESIAAWLIYGSARWQTDSEACSALQLLADFVIEGLRSEDLAQAFIAADVLADLLGQSLTIITKHQLSQVWPAVSYAMERSSDHSSEERMPLLSLLANWGRSMIPNMVDFTSINNYRELFARLTSHIFSIDWAEDGCEQLFVLTDFWLDFAEHAVESTASNSDENYRQTLAEILYPVVQAYYDVLDRKDESTMADVDPDYVEDWKRVRQDFAELLIRLMATDFIPVYGICADQIETALERGDWLRVESVLHLMNDMTNDWDASPSAEQGLAKIFDSDLFRNLSDPGMMSGMSIQLKRVIVRFVDNYSVFFRQKPERIPATMTVLVSLVEETAATSSKLADVAARCISSICSSCRQKMTTILPDLLAFCARTLSQAVLTSYQKEKIYGGVAYVVGALPNEDAKVEAVHLLLQRLTTDAGLAEQALRNQELNVGAQYLTTTFGCLAAIGKAIHDRQRQITILDDEDHDIPSSTNAHKHSPWSQPAGEAINAQIISIMQLVSLCPTDGEAWESACEVLRIGLQETEPGPFVFAPVVVRSFLSAMNPDHPRLEAMLTTSCAYISALSRSTSERRPDDIAQVLGSVSNIVLALPSPTRDPALAQMTIDVFVRSLHRYADVVFAAPSTPTVLHFVLSALIADAPILKRAASSFMSAILALPLQFSRGELEAPTQETGPLAQRVVHELLPHVASVLAHQVGGHAQRSELEAISKLLRSFVMATPKAKQVLEDAMAGSAFPSEAKAGPQEKRMFINRVVMLRGGRGTTDAVKSFWAECRGTVGSF